VIFKLENIPQDAPPWLVEAFRRLEASQVVTQREFIILDKTHVAPSRPQDGEVRYADGSDWNPGSGAGLYRYDGSTWNFLG
jgi:hypothetical protein